jgi:hypothetical protein
MSVLRPLMEAANRHGTYAARMIGPWINDRTGVVWDQQCKQDRENPEKNIAQCQQTSHPK